MTSPLRQEDDSSQATAPATRRRASGRVSLVLIGAASLGGCGEPVHDQMAQRDVYEHRSQCVQDWGDEKKCEIVTDGPHRGYWFGPSYTGVRYAPSSTSGRIGTAIQPSGKSGTSSSSHVARSGFGSSSVSHSGSSSS